MNLGFSLSLSEGHKTEPIARYFLCWYRRRSGEFSFPFFFTIKKSVFAPVHAITIFRSRITIATLRIQDKFFFFVSTQTPATHRLFKSCSQEFSSIPRFSSQLGESFHNIDIDSEMVELMLRVFGFSSCFLRGLCHILYTIAVDFPNFPMVVYRAFDFSGIARRATRKFSLKLWKLIGTVLVFMQYVSAFPDSNRDYFKHVKDMFSCEYFPHSDASIAFSCFPNLCTRVCLKRGECDLGLGMNALLSGKMRDFHGRIGESKWENRV